MTGLTAAEVADRVARGLNNAIPPAPTRSVGQIVRGNVLTPINLVIGILAALVIVAGSPKDALFGGVIIANSVIGVVQELRAKKVLDSLSVINAPHARASNPSPSTAAVRSLAVRRARTCARRPVSSTEVA